MLSTKYLILPPDLLKKLNFSFSYHYIELKRLRLVDRFFSNVNLVKEKGCSYVVQLNWCDEYEEVADEIKKTCMDNIGALPQLAATRDEINLHSNVRLYTKHTPKMYLQTGEEFDSPLFRFTMQNFMVKRKEFCYAGKWSYVLNLGTGIIKPCYASYVRQNIFADTNKPIKLTATGKHCFSPFCMNSSHFLSMGTIPTLQTPIYAALRNRKCTDGSEWYNSTMKEALSQKLSDNNSYKLNMLNVHKQYVYDLLAHGLIACFPYTLKIKLKKLIKKNKGFK